MYLVLHGYLSGQRVVRVPLLVEAQAQLLHLVLGLQAPRGLPCVRVTGAGGVELLRGRRPQTISQTANTCRRPRRVKTQSDAGSVFIETTDGREQ